MPRCSRVNASRIALPSESPSIRFATQPTLMRSQGRPQTFSLYSLK